MSLLDSLRYRLYLLTHRDEADRDAAEEIAFHLQQDALMEGDGDSAARRRFGNVTYYREELRRMSSATFATELLQDARFALRSFRRTPTFTAVAVLTLAVGIGANTAIFSAVDALLLRPMQFREPERLMSVNLTRGATGNMPVADDVAWSYPRFAVFRDGQTVFSDLAVWSGQKFTVRLGDDALREAGEFTDSHYLSLLGIKPAKGRGFSREQDSNGGPHVACISDALWRRLFNSDPEILTRTIDVDGTRFDIIGVMPAGFRGLSGAANIWIPIGAPPVIWANLVGDPNGGFHRIVGRLATGVTVAKAEATARVVGARVDATFPLRGSAPSHLGVAVHELDSLRVDDRLRLTLYILVGAVGLVLLICCANVANLFLVRASSRRREIATRLALGASRARLIRQLLAESVILSTAGGLGSLVIAWAGVHMLSSLELASVLKLQNRGGLGMVNDAVISLNGATLAFTATIAIGTGLLFGLIPALQSTRPSLVGAIKGGTGDTERSRKLSSGNVLVMVEIALAVVLLAGSGLMMRSLSHLLAVPPGFDASGVLAGRVNRSPAWARDSISRFYDVALQRLAAIPGISNVAMIDCAPLESCDGGPIRALDKPLAPNAAPAMAGAHWITPAFFSVMHVPILAGRTFDSRDSRNAQPVVILSQTAARALWPDENPVGRLLAVGITNFDSALVIGVVGDVHYGAMDTPLRPEVYVSYYQNPLSFRMMLLMRTSGDPAARANEMRSALKEVAPGFPLYDVSTMSSRLDLALAQSKFSALLLTIFAALALLLAAMGTYGVISFSVAQRTRELGVRSALGASSAVIVRLVVGQGVRLACIGGVAGLGVAVVVTHVLSSLLYDVRATDPLTYAAIIAVLSLAVLVASWMPARRAVGIPVVQALRAE